jgi:circadian clock protein KaiC
VLTGSARLAQEAKDRAAVLAREQEIERRNRELDRRRRDVAAQVEFLYAQLASEEAEVALLNREGLARERQFAAERAAMGVSRHVAPTLGESGKPAGRRNDWTAHDRTRRI